MVNHPIPKPHAENFEDRQQLVSDAVVSQQLQSLAAVDIAEHAQIYEQLLAGLQHDLNQTGRGGQ